MREYTIESQREALATALASRNDATDALSQDTFSGAYPDAEPWAIGPFEVDESLTFVLDHDLPDPLGIGWTAASIFNPSIIAQGDDLVLFYRASPRKESLSSRIGMARRSGTGWTHHPAGPIVVPTLDNELWGCEDPKIYRAEGRYYLFYNGIFPVTDEDRAAYPSAGYPVESVGCDINLAVSDDLEHWQKLGPIMDHETSRLWAKGAVIPRSPDGDAVRIGGEYLMFVSEGCDGRSTIGRSDDLVHWAFEPMPYLDLASIGGRVHEVACAVVADPEREDGDLVLDFFYDDAEHRFAAGQARYDLSSPFQQRELSLGGSLAWGGLLRHEGRWTFAQGWDAPPDTRTIYFYRERA